MSLNELLVYGGYLALLFVILLTYKYSKRVTVINFLTFLLYTFYFLYGLYFKSESGSGLFWGALILLFTGIHFGGIVIYLVLKWINNPQETFVNKKYLLLTISSLVLVVLGVVSRVSHWPFGNLILFAGAVIFCFTVVFFVIKHTNK